MNKTLKYFDSGKIFPEQLAVAVDDISSLKEEAKSLSSPDCIYALEGVLMILARLLRLFHHAFDPEIDRRTVCESLTDDLIEWCCEYDRDFKIFYDLLQLFKTSIKR